MSYTQRGQNTWSLVNDIISFRDGNILVTQIQRMGTLLDLVNLTKNSDKSVYILVILQFLPHGDNCQVHHWAHCNLPDCWTAWTDWVNPCYANCPCRHQTWQFPSLPHPIICKVYGKPWPGRQWMIRILQGVFFTLKTFFLAWKLKYLMKTWILNNSPHGFWHITLVL